MDLNQKERLVIQQFKWISIIVLGLGILVASFVFYSVSELVDVHKKSFDNVVAIEEGSVIVLELQKLVAQMLKSSDKDQFAVSKAQFIEEESMLYTYFDKLKANSSFPSEVDHMVLLYNTWRAGSFESLVFGVKNEASLTYFQDLEAINTQVGELEELQYEDSDVQFHEMIMRIQWGAYLLIGIAVILSLGIQMAVRRIERTNASRIAFIQESQLLYLKVAESMPDAMLLINNETGALLDANQAASTMYGYSISELLQLRNVDLSAEPEQTKKAGNSQVSEVPLRYHKTKDGRVFPVEIRASRLVWKGIPVHMAWVHDISERMKLQQTVLEALEEAKAGERAKASFLANVTHEIRTPLNGIYGALQLLDSEKLDSETQNLRHIALESSQAIIQVMDQILEYSMLEVGHYEFKAMTLSLGQVIRDVSTLLSPYAYSKKIGLHIVNPEEAPEWVGDPIRIKQVIIQLVSNAIKFTAEGGQVTLEACADQEHRQVLIHVTDTGCGIKAEDMNRIFRWFEQVDLSQTKAYSGIGLGLATAKGVISYLGGQILVESVSGSGSRFTIVLPEEALDV